MTLICTDLIWYEMRAGMVTTAMQSSQVQDGPSTVQVSTTREQRGNRCRSGQRSESLESMAPSGCTCTLIYHLSSHISNYTNKDTFDIFCILSEVNFRKSSRVGVVKLQTLSELKPVAVVWQKIKRTCQNRDFCNAGGPVGAEGSRPLLQGIVELLRIPSKLTLNQQIHRAGMVAVVFQNELLPWKREEILSDQCCCSRKGSENQVKFNFSWKPTSCQKSGMQVWPSLTIYHHPEPSTAILIPRLSVPDLPVPVQCLIVLRICKGMGQELLEVIHWEGSTMHDVVVNVDAEKQKW